MAENYRQQQQQQQQRQPSQLPEQQAPAAGRTAFNWHVYSNRKSALLHLRKSHTLADIILQTEDGSAGELVHSQVMSAFGDKLSDFIKNNGHFVDAATYANAVASQPSAAGVSLATTMNQVQQQRRQQTIWSSPATGPNEPSFGKWREQAERVKSIRLPKLNKYTLHILVECAYTGSICTDLQSGGIWQILELADHYQMQDVIRACCSFLAKNLNQHNCVRFYHVGLKHQHPLMRSAWHTIRAHFKHILAENLLHLQLDPHTMEPLVAPAAAAIAAAASAASSSSATGFMNRSAVPISTRRSTSTVSTSAPAGSSMATTTTTTQQSSNVDANDDDDVSKSGADNWLATILFEHFHELLMHDKLNVEREESVWFAIKLWCQFPTRRSRRNPAQLAANVASPMPMPMPLVEAPSASSSARATVATKTPAELVSAAKTTGNELPAPPLAEAERRRRQTLEERAARVTDLLPCMRFPRFRTGTEFSTQRIWRDPLIFSNKQAQHQLAVLDRNHRDFLSSSFPYFGSHSSSSPGSLHQAGSQSAAAAATLLTTAVATMSASSSLSSSSNGYYYQNSRDGFGLPCALHPRQLRPRVPHSILLAIGGWQQGQPTKLIESYDLNCNLWFESKHKILLPLAYHGIENVAGQLYICGGTNGNDILNEVFTFDPLTGDCRQVASMREARCYVSTAYLDGYLYAMGGHNGLQRVKSAERLQIIGGQAGEATITGPQQQQAQGQWTHVQDMQVARSDGSACVHGGRIYIAGGLNDQVIESSVEFYNQQDNTWTFIARMITPRTSFTLLAYPLSAVAPPFGRRRRQQQQQQRQRNSTVANEQQTDLEPGGGHEFCLLAIGGNDGQERLASVEKFDFSTNSWSLHSNMRHRRSTFSACLLDQTKLIVVGGYNGQTPFNQVEMFDWRQQEWVMLKKMRFDRSGLKVVVVNDLANASDYTYLGNAEKILQ